MYYVIELQTTNNTGAVIPFSFSDQNQAEAKYHSLLAVCAVSEVDKHGVMLVNDSGIVIKSEVYIHNNIPE